MSAKLRVILQDEIRKPPLPSGICPETLEELQHIVQEIFPIEEDVSM